MMRHDPPPRHDAARDCLGDVSQFADLTEGENCVSRLSDKKRAQRLRKREGRAIVQIEIFDVPAWREILRRDDNGRCTPSDEVALDAATERYIWRRIRQHLYRMRESIPKIRTGLLQREAKDWPRSYAGPRKKSVPPGHR
jgi:hypothetical protein